MAENIHISTVLKYNKTYLLVVIIVSDLRQKTIDYIKNRFFVDLPNIFQLFPLIFKKNKKYSKYNFFFKYQNKSYQK